MRRGVQSVLGFWDHIVFLFTGSPDRVSALSRPATRAGIRPVIHRDQLEDWHPAMVSRRLSATGIRFSAILRPPRNPALLAVGLPDHWSGPRRDYRVPHIRAATGVGALCAPGTTVLTPNRSHFPAGVRRFAAASPFPSPTVPPARMLLNEASTKGSRMFARPVFPSPVAARMERAALGLEPRASHPADQEPDDARRGGDRPSSTDLELRAQLTSVDLQSGSSLVMCDLASHVAKHSPGGGPADAWIVPEAVVRGGAWLRI